MFLFRKSYYCDKENSCHIFFALLNKQHIQDIIIANLCLLMFKHFQQRTYVIYTLLLVNPVPFIFRLNPKGF